MHLHHKFVSSASLKTHFLTQSQNVRLELPYVEKFTFSRIAGARTREMNQYFVKVICLANPTTLL